MPEHDIRADPPTIPVDPLQFPDTGRLKLDQAIDVLLEHARTVRDTQERLRSLLRASHVVASHVDLSRVLRHVVDAAKDLVNARYAALGVLGPDGTVDEFVYSGLDDQRAARIGHPPHGQGILGLLITEPRPIRLTDLSTHPASAGFPPGHPPMRSFLGVPLLVRGQAFGNLYLADKQDEDEFSADDEQLLLSLAGFAAVAIDNAHLYEEAQRRAAWQRSSAEITAALLAGTETEDVLRLIAAKAHEVARADLAAVVLPVDGTGVLTVQAAAGEDDVAGLVGRRLDTENSLCELAMTGSQPLLSEDLSKDERGPLSDETWAGKAGPGMVAPLMAPDRPPTGVLVVANAPGRRGFHERDLEMLAAFASQAALAQQLAQHRTHSEELQLLEERDRIARDLHDHVIQEVFATGLSLSNLASAVDSGQRDRVLAVVHKLDQVVSEIRGTIFNLHAPMGAGGDAEHSLRRALSEIARTTTDSLGFTPVLRLDGPLDTLVPARLAVDLSAVVREALSNIARHAHATTATVQVSATPTTLTARVEDDGHGLGDTTRRSGLANLRARAEKHGGDLSIDSAPGQGTILNWTVPLPHGDPTAPGSSN
ncbi:sensor histidine kinase [Amycolatopsis keratiniphila]|uniref:sensor histidine kinase n=1 Tax=Amycolatopsis keratiniphila TaxID=129921 RepID=UPI000ADB6E15|nr:GAF domain-containing protein [Amycolatopsis keratiniphila]